MGGELCWGEMVVSYVSTWSRECISGASSELIISKCNTGSCKHCINLELEFSLTAAFNCWRLWITEEKKTIFRSSNEWVDEGHACHPNNPVLNLCLLNLYYLASKWRLSTFSNFLVTKRYWLFVFVKSVTTTILGSDCLLIFSSLSIFYIFHAGFIRKITSNSNLYSQDKIFVAYIFQLWTDKTILPGQLWFLTRT